MENLPGYIYAFIVVATILTVWLFYKANRKSLRPIFVVLVWIIIQSIISLTGFYTITNTIPPRFALLLVPPLILIATLFLTSKGKSYIDNLDHKFLVLLHVTRLPVELILLLLFVHKAIPQLMTFEGRNLDIISGLTAPVIFYLGFIRKRISIKILLLWNLVCLGLLINILVVAILSAPFPFQKFAFDQPNIAVLYFPFVWLPCCIVPLVLFSHLASIRHLLLKTKSREANNFVVGSSV